MDPQHVPMTVTARPESFTFEAGATVVIVVDMQNDFGDPAGMFGRAGIDLTSIRGTIEPTSKVPRLPLSLAGGLHSRGNRRRPPTHQP
jgi:hypothetical protein